MLQTSYHDYNILKPTTTVEPHCVELDVSKTRVSRNSPSDPWQLLLNVSSFTLGSGELDVSSSWLSQTHLSIKFP